jgi:hypothetical protein
MATRDIERMSNYGREYGRDYGVGDTLGLGAAVGVG